MQLYLITFAGKNGTGGMAVGSQVIPARSAHEAYQFGRAAALEHLPADAREDATVLAATRMPISTVVCGPDGRRYVITLNMASI